MPDFTWFYKFLFNEFISEVKEKDRAWVGVIIGKYLFQDKTIADREINACACCLEIADTLEVEVVI